VTPAGTPVVEKETDCEVPEAMDVVIVFVTDDPCATDLFPPLDSVKAKLVGGGGVVPVSTVGLPPFSKIR
jgi:hypothetical protein